MRMVAVTDPKHVASHGGPSWRIAISGMNGAYASIAGWEYIRFSSYTLCCSAIGFVVKANAGPEQWIKQEQLTGRQAWRI